MCRTCVQRRRAQRRRWRKRGGGEPLNTATTNKHRLLSRCVRVCVCVCVCARARVSHRTSPMPPSPRLESHSGQEQTSAAEELEERVESLEGTLESCYSEIHRGNAIIARLQGELAAARGDVRVRSDVAVQQEERIEQLQAECSQLRQDLKR